MEHYRYHYWSRDSGSIHGFLFSRIRVQLLTNKYAFLAVALTVGLILYRFSPTDYWFWPKCPVKLITGLSCPACGIQRFIHALTNGNVKEALAYNYYLIYAIPYTLCVVTTYYLPQSRLKDRMTEVFEGKTAVWLCIITFCIWFVVRNILDI